MNGAEKHAIVNISPMRPSAGDAKAGREADQRHFQPLGNAAELVTISNAPRAPQRPGREPPHDQIASLDVAAAPRPPCLRARRP